jgi:hypothetical protein
MTARRRRLARALLLTGAALAVVAGLVQATIGAQIPSWTGRKADPGPLGLLTIALGAAALVAAVPLTGPDRRGAVRAAAGAVVGLVAVIGFTTVGRLWYVPGPLLLLGLAISIEDPFDVLATARREWWRVLLVALGCCELLMIVRARPLAMALGALAAVALMAAAASAARRRTIALAILGPLPFALLTWTAIVPVLVSVIAVVVALGSRRPARAVAPLVGRDDVAEREVVG